MRDLGTEVKIDWHLEEDGQSSQALRKIKLFLQLAAFGIAELLRAGPAHASWPCLCTSQGTGVTD